MFVFKDSYKADQEDTEPRSKSLALNVFYLAKHLTNLTNSARRRLLDREGEKTSLINVTGEINRTPNFTLLIAAQCRVSD